MIGDITSANAALVLLVDELFPAGVPLEQFATDQSYSMDAVTVSKTQMGVDGRLTAAFTPSLKTVTVKLEASSPSYLVMEQLYQAMEYRKRLYHCTLVARVPSIHRVITWTDGVLKSGTPVAAAGPTLGPTTWKFEFALINLAVL